MNGAISGKTAVVVGGASGIGRATARALSAAGAAVLIAGRDENRLAEARRDLEARPGSRVVSVACDVTDPEGTVHLANEAIRLLGRADVVVNSAGFHAPRRSFGALTSDDWDSILAVNATGLFNLLKAFVPLFRRQEEGGHFVHVSSVAASAPSVPAGSAYTAAKHAALGLIRTIAREEGSRTVRFSSVSPGPTDTPLVDTRPEPPTADERARFLRPETVAEAVVFVAGLPPGVFVEELLLKPALA